MTFMHDPARPCDETCDHSARSTPAEALDVPAELLELAEKVNAARWDVDWNSPNLILRSDGSGKLLAKAFEPHVSDFIVAAARYIAALRSPESDEAR